MFVIVSNGEPAPGRPPISPAATLPTPWPTSSRFGLCRVPVSESATREISRLSTDPSRARITAGSRALATNAAVGISNCSCGSPIGTCPMIGASCSQNSPRRVPASNATSGAGRRRANRRGQNMPTASVNAPMAKAPVLTLAASSGHARIAPSAPPGAAGMPSSGKVCISMTMMPIPDMKPDTTTCGV